MWNGINQRILRDLLKKDNMSSSLNDTKKHVGKVWPMARDKSKSYADQLIIMYASGNILGR